MADDQKIYLSLGIKGAADVVALKNELARLHAEANANGVALTNGQISADQFNDKAAELSPTINNLTKVIRELERALAAQGVAAQTSTATLGATGKAADAATGKTNGLNMAVRSLGFGVSDVFANNGPIGQKLGGFANNVGGLVTGIAGAIGKLTPATMAVAAGLEIAVTATGAALTAAGIKSVDDLVAYITGGEKKAESTLERLTERINELTEKKHLIPVEILELENAKRVVKEIKDALDAIEKLKTGQTEAEAKSGKAVGSALTEAVGPDGKPIGGDAIAAKLKADEIKRLSGDSAELREAIAEQPKQQAKIDSLNEARKSATSVEELQAINSQLLPAMAALAAAAKRQTDLQSGFEAQADQTVGGVLAKAQGGKGDVQTQAQGQLAAMLNQSGFGGVAAQIPGLSAANIAAADAKKKAEKKAEDEAAEKKKKHDAEIDSLNKTGAANQKESQPQIDALAKAQKQAAKDADEADAGSEKFREKAAKEKEAKAKKDRADLEKGLGDDFLAQAEARRIDIETNPAFRGHRDAARFANLDQTQRAANQTLLSKGMEGGRAAELASQAPGFINADIQRQMDLARAKGADGSAAQIMQLVRQQLATTGNLMTTIDGVAADLANYQAAAARQAQQADQIRRQAAGRRESARQSGNGGS